jgi:hypothetical protein
MKFQNLVHYFYLPFYICRSKKSEGHFFRKSQQIAKNVSPLYFPYESEKVQKNVLAHGSAG